MSAITPVFVLTTLSEIWLSCFIGRFNSNPEIQKLSKRICSISQWLKTEFLEHDHSFLRKHFRNLKLLRVLSRQYFRTYPCLWDRHLNLENSESLLLMLLSEWDKFPHDKRSCVCGHG